MPDLYACDARHADEPLTTSARLRAIAAGIEEGNLNDPRGVRVGTLRAAADGIERLLATVREISELAPGNCSLAPGLAVRALLARGVAPQEATGRGLEPELLYGPGRAARATTRLAPPSDAGCEGVFYGCANLLPEDRCGRCVPSIQENPNPGPMSDHPSYPAPPRADPASLPAKSLLDYEIEREIAATGALLDSMFSDPETDGHCGSPGEWMIERLDELETEKARRLRSASAKPL